MAETNAQRKISNRRVTFRLKAASVKEVALVGDFNNWDAASHPMNKGEDGTWKVRLMLPPGEYQYKLLVDGQWRLDCGNKQTVPNGFGTENNVLMVSEK